MAKNIEQKGRQAPSQQEKAVKKATFKGRERRTKWNFNFLDTGQFVQFTYNHKPRKCMILSPVWKTSKKTKVVTAIDVTEMAWSPPELAKLFNVKVLPRIVRVEHIDDDGFRYFAVNFDLTRRGGQARKLWKLMQARHPILHNNYKTFKRKELQTGVIHLYNPIFSPATIDKFNIFGVE